MTKIVFHVSNDAPADGQVPTYNATTGEYEPKTPSGGGAAVKDYASFYLSTGGLTGISATVVTLGGNETAVVSDSAVFTLQADTVTVEKTGVFKVEADLYLNSGSNKRSEYSSWLERNSVEVPGTRMANYARGYDSGDTANLTAILAVTAGDVFRLRCKRTDGAGISGYQDPDGTRLVFTEM